MTTAEVIQSNGLSSYRIEDNPHYRAAVLALQEKIDLIERDRDSDDEDGGSDSADSAEDPRPLEELLDEKEPAEYCAALLEEGALDNNEGSC
jgi:hypothetical protein